MDHSFELWSRSIFKIIEIMLIKIHMNYFKLTLGLNIVFAAVILSYLLQYAHMWALCMHLKGQKLGQIRI